MTEQEFRDKLKQSVGHAELSSDRQAKVLAGMKGAECKVRTTNKLKVCLVLAVLVVLGVTGAVATELVDYINWKGEPVDYDPPMYVEYEVQGDRLRDPTAEMLISSKKLEEVLLIDYPASVRQAAHETDVASLEELRQLVGDDTLLPIPISVPEGFTLAMSRVIFVGKAGMTYRYLGEERYKDVIRVKRYECDMDDLLLAQYFLYFRDSQDEHLNFSARLIYDTDYYLQTNAGEYGLLQVPGVEQGVYINEEDRTRIYLLKELSEPVDGQIALGGFDGLQTPGLERRYIALELQANSTVCDVDTMLACFGLTAQ